MPASKCSIGFSERSVHCARRGSGQGTGSPAAVPTRIMTCMLILFLFAATLAGSYDDWRAQREAALKADDGWLTVAGLFWLKDGYNTVGSDHTNDIVLERGPGRIGV